MFPCDLFSVSGNETEALDYIKGITGGEYDSLGSLIVKTEGKGKNIAIACFVDEPGLFVTDITDGIRFALIGKADAATLKNRQVRFKNGVRGVICSKKTEDIKLGDLYIVADEDLEIGDVARFELNEIKDGSRISGLSSDRAAVIETLLKAKELLSGFNITYMFTTMYKIGKKGLYSALLREKPDYTVVIDTVSGEKIKCGCGPVVKVIDGSYTADPYLHSFARDKKTTLAAFKQPEIAAPNSFMVGAVCGYVSIPVEKNDGIITYDVTDTDKTAQFIKEFVAKVNKI